MAARKRGRPRKHKDIESLSSDEYKAIALDRSQRGSFEAKLKWMIYGARDRAKKGEFECTVTAECYAHQTHCAALPEVKFEVSNGVENRDTSPSIDRLDPMKGYTPENTWIVCGRVNRIKNDATLEELEEICRNLRAEMTRRGLIKP